MNYWIHRISHIAELSYPLLEKGYLTIGFSDFTQTEIIECVSKNNWGEFNDYFQEYWGTVPRTRHNLWNFLKMSKGDTVIVPSWGTYFVCEIEDEKAQKINNTYSENLFSWGDKKVNANGVLLTKEDGNIYDLGFARKIKIIHREISRDKFADSKLTSRMKIRQTNALINDLEESVIKSIENFKANKPIHLHSLIIDKIAHLVLETIMNELNPDKFERLVQVYFNTIGATEVTIPAKNETNKEGDADIVAVFENMKLIIYTQAKFQNGTINEWATNQILDYVKNKETIADGYNKIAWVITTAENYNEEAKNIAKENGIQLINGIEFAKMVLNVGLNPLNTVL